MANTDKFEYFPAETADPIGKYKQPVEYTQDYAGNGYPNNIANTQTQKKRGTGAATKGTGYSKDSN